MRSWDITFVWFAPVLVLNEQPGEYATAKGFVIRMPKCRDAVYRRLLEHEKVHVKQMLLMVLLPAMAAIIVAAFSVELMGVQSPLSFALILLCGGAALVYGLKRFDRTKLYREAAAYAVSVKHGASLRRCAEKLTQYDGIKITVVGASALISRFVESGDLY